MNNDLTPEEEILADRWEAMTEAEKNELYARMMENMVTSPPQPKPPAV